MLLFGGNLSGVKHPNDLSISIDVSKTTLSHAKQHVPGSLSPLESPLPAHNLVTFPFSPQTAQRPQTGQEPASVSTPHTDALQRLTNHEIRLLEELERTRSKLQAEWRIKLRELRANGNGTTLLGNPQSVSTEHLPTGVKLDELSQQQLIDLILMPTLQHDVNDNKTRQSGLHVVGARASMRALPANKKFRRDDLVPTRSMKQLDLSTMNGSSSSSSSSSLSPSSHSPLPVSVTAPLQEVPMVRSGFETLLPILTTNAETPFEIGLEKKNHMLPIFHLPNVRKDATKKDKPPGSGNATNRDDDGSSGSGAKSQQHQQQPQQQQKEAVEIDLREAARRQKEHDEFLAASEKLGLSVEEIRRFEAQLGGSPTDSNNNASNPHTEENTAYTSPQVAWIGTSSMPQQQGTSGSNKIQGSKHKTKHKHRRRTHSKDGTPLTSQQQINSLQNQLATALCNVQQLTQVVKNDVYEAQQFCPRSSTNAYLFMRKWGKAKVEAIFRRLLFHMKSMAFTKWRQTIAFEIQQEKKTAYLMYKGTKQLDLFLLQWVNRKLKQAWDQWYGMVMKEKACERAVLEVDAIKVLQRAWRSFCARRIVRLIQRHQQESKRQSAAVRIQRHYRGRMARQFFKLKQKFNRQQCAATRIQALARGYIQRRKLQGIKMEHIRHLAAARIQALARGHFARQRVAIRRRDAKVNAAALRIQRHYRGRLGRAKFIRRQIERHRNQAAIVIQTALRGFHARFLLKELKLAKQQSILRQNKAATKIQSVYRGHVARIATELKRIAFMEKQAIKHAAAIKIQKMIRKHQAMRKVKSMRQEHFKEMIFNARAWVEYWSEDSGQWFYYNGATGQAVWTPPSTGYTKSDGLLVLQNGRILPNPEEGKELDFFDQDDEASRKQREQEQEQKRLKEEQEEELARAEEQAEQFCVECEVEEARKKCFSCQDVFCDACFEKLHASSKRQQHIWKAIGSLRCIECEKLKATRFCVVCQDGFCLGCFKIIHTKGNKANHSWKDMASMLKARRVQAQAQAQAQGMEENEQTYQEYLQSSEYQYVTGYQEDQQANGNASGYANTAAAGGSEWMLLHDDSSGYDYYYNTQTGETRWAT